MYHPISKEARERSSGAGRIGRENLRISYADSRENLAQALERTRTFLETAVPLEPATTAC